MIYKQPSEHAVKGSWQETAELKRSERDALVRPFVEDTSRVLSEDVARPSVTNIVDIEQLTKAILAGDLTAEQIAVAHIKQIAKAQQQTNCLTEVLFTEAIEDAKKLDAHFRSTGKLVGPLHGVPITVKDQFNVKGYDTTLGYTGRAFKPADQDAYIVETLRKMGAVVLAKTNIPQSIMWCETDNPLWGLTTNPRNPAFTPGGSTGGEACVLNFGGSLLGWGTDIGGSIRIPSHMCGLYGLKPTSSRLSYVGVPVSTEGQQHVPSSVGPLTRSLESLVFTMKTLLDAEPWEFDPAVTPKPWDQTVFTTAQSRPLTIGVMYDDGVVKVHPPIERALFEMTGKLKAAGHEVVRWDSSLHADCINIMDQYYTADGCEDILTDINAGGDPMIERVESLVNLAPAISVYEYWQLNKEKIRLQKAYYEKWNSCRGPSGRRVDVLLTPTMSHTALPHKGCRWVGYTKVWNFLDYPAISFPGGVADKRMDHEKDTDYVPRNEIDEWSWSRYDAESMHNHPVGLQLVGRRLTEELVLGAAKVCEALMRESRSQSNGVTSAPQNFDWNALLSTQ